MKFTHCRRVSLITHIISIAEPLRQYYQKLFSTEVRHSYNLQQLGKSFKRFDTLFLKGKENDLTRLFLLANELENFVFTKFTENCIENIDGVVKSTVQESNKPFEWDCINGKMQYKTIIVKKGIQLG